MTRFRFQYLWISSLLVNAIICALKYEETCCTHVSLRDPLEDCFDFKKCDKFTVSFTCRIGRVCLSPMNLSKVNDFILSMKDNLTKEVIHRHAPQCAHNPVHVRNEGDLRCAIPYSDLKNTPSRIIGLIDKLDTVWMPNMYSDIYMLDFNDYLLKLNATYNSTTNTVDTNVTCLQMIPPDSMPLTVHNKTLLP
ncbi:envelope protein UL128 [Aotine betaherpesvirus 1]|uniref:Envelope protein UL128 n=1 Tax=Aotine betaherpesvirus 1 TaxID=50290 RepID=G8XUI2_9BETA|nr:envelope protein UL128 [Aotine betaherpesvirus 1]AEV80823.1 envelope protein UL128 [Aotine betaherpesvirus 1]